MKTDVFFCGLLLLLVVGGLGNPGLILGKTQCGIWKMIG